MFFTFPEDARWNADQQSVEFGVEIGEYSGVVRVPRRVFQLLLPEPLTPGKCVEAYYLQRTRSRASSGGSAAGGGWPRIAGGTCAKAPGKDGIDAGERLKSTLPNPDCVSSVQGSFAVLRSAFSRQLVTRPRIGYTSDKFCYRGHLCVARAA